MNKPMIDSNSPNPLKIIQNISCFKKVIKGFKTSNLEDSIDIIMYQPKLIHSCMTKGFTIEDAVFFKLSCKVYYNIPIISSAWFGSEKGYALHPADHCEENSNTTDFGRNQLLGFLKDKPLPEQIRPISIEMNQTIEDIESTFTFKVNPK